MKITTKQIKTSIDQLESFIKSKQPIDFKAIQNCLDPLKAKLTQVTVRRADKNLFERLQGLLRECYEKKIKTKDNKSNKFRQYLYALYQEIDQILYPGIAGKLYLQALKQGTRGIRQFLREKNDLNHTNQYGQTALHIAASQGEEQVVYALLNAGVNPEIKDNAGKTAEMMASTFEVRSLIATRLPKIVEEEEPSLEAMEGPSSELSQAKSTPDTLQINTPSDSGIDSPTDEELLDEEKEDQHVEQHPTFESDTESVSDFDWEDEFIDEADRKRKASVCEESSDVEIVEHDTLLDSPALDEFKSRDYSELNSKQEIKKRYQLTWGCGSESDDKNTFSNDDSKVKATAISSVFFKPQRENVGSISKQSILPVPKTLPNTASFSTIIAALRIQLYSVVTYMRRGKKISAEQIKRLQEHIVSLQGRLTLENVKEHDYSMLDSIGKQLKQCLDLQQPGSSAQKLSADLVEKIGSLSQEITCFLLMRDMPGYEVKRA